MLYFNNGMKVLWAVGSIDRKYVEKYCTLGRNMITYNIYFFILGIPWEFLVQFLLRIINSGE